MSLREKITGDKKLIELKNFGQIRDAAIQALNKNGGLFFESYKTAITIEGKVNENGVVAVFEIDSDTIKNAKQVKDRPLIEKLQEKISKRLVELKDRLSETNNLTQITISLGIEIPFLAKTAITITLEKA